MLFRSQPSPNSLAVNIDGSYRTLATEVKPGWTHVALTRSGGTLKAYINGALAHSFSMPETGSLAIGGMGDLRGAASFSGLLDEVRWADADRSGEWIGTEYSNQTDPTSFCRVGVLEPIEPEKAEFRLLERRDPIAEQAGGNEDISKRTRNSRHFRNSDGTWTAILGDGINDFDLTGKPVPSLVEVWQAGAEAWTVRRGRARSLISRTAGGHDVGHAYEAPDEPNTCSH